MDLFKVPTRLVVGMMIFSGCIVNYTMRVNLSVGIVAMVPLSSNNSQDVQTLGWSTYEKAHVISGYFWTYALSSLICGPVSEYYGPRIVVLITNVIGALLTLASPPAAKYSYLALLVVRLLLGLCAGFIFQSAYILIVHWAGPFERGKFMSTIVAGTGGTVVSWVLCGFLIDNFGWEWAFYFFGISTLLWCVLWWYLVYDTPNEHPRISLAEKQYIMSVSFAVNHIKSSPPYGQIFKSKPVWALLFLFFGNGWGMFLVVNAAPMFIANVLGSDISTTCLLSSVTYSCRIVCSFAFGAFGDFLVKRGVISLRLLRKSFCLISHLTPGVVFILLAMATKPLTAIILLTVAMGFSGAVSVTNIANVIDISPNFPGTISGAGNFFASIAGILTSLSVAYFTKDNESRMEAWVPVFYISATIYITSAVFFLFFGSTEIQNWNNCDWNNDSETVVYEYRKLLPCSDEHDRD